MSMTNAYIVIVQSPTEDDACLDNMTTSPPTRGRTFVQRFRWFGDALIRWKETRMYTSAFAEMNSGMLLIILAHFFFVCMNLGVKQLNSLDVPVHTLELIAVRMAITFICSVLYMVIMKIPDPFIGPKGVRLLLVYRGLFGFFGLFGMYYSLQYLSLADATVLSFLYPLSIAIGGHFILKEPYSKHEAFAAIFSLLGVVLIARPPFLFGDVTDVNPGSDDTTLIATAADRIRTVGVALFGVVLGTGATLSIRAIGTRAHPMHLMTFLSAWSTVVAAAAMYFMDVPIVYPQRWMWVAMLVFIGLSGFVAQTLITIGYQRETATRGSMGQYVQLLFAGTMEYAFFGTVPSTLSLVGAAIIIASAIYVLFTKKSLPERSETIRLREPDFSIEECLLCDDDSPNRVVKFTNASSSSTITVEDGEGLAEKPEVSSS